MRSSSPHKIGRRPRITFQEWCDLFVAGFELARARLVVRSSARRALEQRATTALAEGTTLASSELIERVGTAIARMGHRLPWRADCLVQAVAAQHWLRRHGLASRLEIGVRERSDDPFEGHAWLVCGDAVVTGGNPRDYQPLRSVKP